MNEHPIEGLMITAMNSIQDMVDVNTIIGEPIETSNNVVIIPISKVSFGFAAGGSEFKGETINEYSKKEKEEEIQYRLPFGGGSGAGVSINPVAFLIVQPNGVKLLPVNHASAMDKLLDYVPDIAEKLNGIVDKAITNIKNQDKEQSNKEQPSKEQKSKDKLANVATNNSSKVKTKKSKKTEVEFEYNESENDTEEDENSEEYDD